MKEWKKKDLKNLKFKTIWSNPTDEFQLGKITKKGIQTFPISNSKNKTNYVLHYNTIENCLYHLNGRFWIPIDIYFESTYFRLKRLFL